MTTNVITMTERELADRLVEAYFEGRSGVVEDTLEALNDYATALEAAPLPEGMTPLPEGMTDVRATVASVIRRFVWGMMVCETTNQPELRMLARAHIEAGAPL